MNEQESPKPAKQRRGFALMNKEQVRKIAALGGVASHRPGAKGHEWDSRSGAQAGRKGGLVSRGGRGKIRSEGG